MSNRNSIQTDRQTDGPTSDRERVTKECTAQYGRFVETETGKERQRRAARIFLPYPGAFLRVMPRF